MTDQPKTTHKPTGMELVKTILTSSEVMTRFASIMGERESAYYINSVILAVANSTDLQECTPTSVVYSALRAAALKLSCDQSLGEAYLVPFFNGKKEVKEAVFIPGYKGLRNLATRTGKYRFVNAGPIYNGMQFVEDTLTGAAKVIGQRVDDTILGWFAYFEMFSGYSKALYMTVDQIHEHGQKYSKTYNSKKSLWQTDPQMAEKKTVLRLLLQRWADLGSAANEALKHDEDILEGKFEIDIPDEIPDKPRQTVEQNMSDLGFDTATADPAPTTKASWETTATTQNGKVSAATVEPMPEPFGENAQGEPDQPETAPDPVPVTQDVIWPAAVLSDCVKNRWVSTEAKVAEVLSRSKFVTPATPHDLLKKWVAYYTDDRKHLDQNAAVTAADNKIANLISVK